MCRLTGFGGDRCGFGVAGFLVFYCDIGFFIFNLSFCFGGILVGNGQWWRGGHGGGAVVVTGQWKCGDRG